MNTDNESWPAHVPATQRGFLSARQLGTIGIIGVSVFLLANVALHFLDPDLNVMETVISDYALGDHGWISSASDFAAAVGLIAIGLGLRSTLVPGMRVAASWVLILLAGCGFVVSGLFETDGMDATESTFGGVLHIIGRMVSIFDLIVCAWMIRGVLSRDNGYKHLARTQHRFAVLITTVAVGTILLAGKADGLSQRVVVIVMVTWWLVLATNVRRSATARPATEQRAHT
jgi:hypothetical protein